MCDIAGMILQPHNHLPELAARLAMMAGAMAHRGLDREGCGEMPNHLDRWRSITAITVWSHATIHHIPQIAGYTCQNLPLLSYTAIADHRTQRQLTIIQCYAVHFSR